MVRIPFTTVPAFFYDAVARNLKQPRKGPVGWLVTKFVFEDLNRGLEENAVKLCNILKDDMVLEAGFGPGIGIQEAYKRIKDGNGKVYGVEISHKMIQKASLKLWSEIEAGKVELILADVAKLPFESDRFDHVFHCNCYYFWDDQVACAKELRRVMKQGAKMVTVLNEQSLKKVNEAGFMKYGNTNKERYMDSLEKAGFCDIDYQELKSERGNPFSAIFASK